METVWEDSINLTDIDIKFLHVPQKPYSILLQTIGLVLDLFPMFHSDIHVLDLILKTTVIKFIQQFPQWPHDDS